MFTELVWTLLRSLPRMDFGFTPPDGASMGKLPKSVENAGWTLCALEDPFTKNDSMV